MTTTCKNCGTHVYKKFCTNCGQNASIGRLKISHVLGEFWHNFTHTDKGYLSFVNSMIKNPGLVIREYFAGKRKKYFNPFTFYLVTTAILIFITSQVYQYEDALYDYRNEYGQLINQHHNLLILCCLPLSAIILKLLFFKRDYNYAEWFTVLIFAIGIINFIQIFIQLLYFPFIAYHASTQSYAMTGSYIILFYILIRFLKPKRWYYWLEIFVVVFILFIIIELIAPLILLGIYGVPVSKLIDMLKSNF